MTKGWRCFAVFSAFLLCFGLFWRDAAAYQSESRWNQKAFAVGRVGTGPKRITDAQLRSAARQLVNRFIGRSFIRKSELPEKCVLSKMAYSGDAPGHTIKFTDMLLNRLLEQPHVIIVNQDLTTHLNLKMSFKLMSYDPPEIAKHKGMLMGASYIISGSLAEAIVSPRGTPQRELTATLILSDIRTGEVMVREQLIKYFK